MKHLIEQRYLLRHNLLAIIGFCLCLYFSYHIIFGERSIIRLMTLERSVSKVSTQYNGLREERSALESKVVRLRSGSLDPDLLEERVRYVLGYVHPDEHVLLGFN